MKLQPLVFFLIMLLLIPPVTADWPLAQFLQVRLNISTTIDVAPLDGTYKLHKAIARMNLYPLSDYRQHLLSSSSQPPVALFENQLVFTWDKPKEKHLSLSLITDTINEYKPIEIKKIIAVPQQSWPPETLPFLKETSLIDFSNETIQSLAHEIIGNETDLFVVVHMLATWTRNNINYSLETVTADASQKASWVLANKKGVCDELTNLFIAFVRSHGIPARFISGIAYTGSDNENGDFVPHGWAEVYFPEYGWAPIDVTFGQIGSIDSTHIKLKQSVDSQETLTQYEWVGTQVKLLPHQLNFSATVLQEGPPVAQTLPYTISLQPRYKKVNIGSFNEITATVKNDNDFYLPLTLTPTHSPGLLNNGNNSLNILLKPFETRNASFKVHVDPSLEKGYSYTFKVGLYDQYNSSSSTTFVAQVGSTVLDESLNNNNTQLPFWERIVEWLSGWIA